MANAFKSIADPTRREILEDLSVRPMAVHELADLYAISRPAISRHLGIMMEAGLIGRRRSGKENIYHLNTEPLMDIQKWLDRFWTERLTKLKDLSEGEMQ